MSEQESVDSLPVRHGDDSSVPRIMMLISDHEKALAAANEQIEQLRAAIATPDIYAGIISEVAEKDFAEQIAGLKGLDIVNEGIIKRLQQQNTEQAKEIERLVADNNVLCVAHTADVADVTPDILEAVEMLITDWNGRRDQGETGLDPDALSPQMRKIEELLADLRAGRIVCQRRPAGGEARD